MRSVTGILFSLWRISGSLETNGHHQLIEIINDALIKAVELRSFLLLQFLVPREGLEEASRKRSVDFFEELQEHQADGISFREQSIPAGLGDLLHEALGPELGKIVPQRSQTVLFR